MIEIWQLFISSFSKIPIKSVYLSSGFFSEVLILIREKYLQIELFDRDEVSADLRLVLDIINQLKPLPGEEISEHIKQR